MSIQESVVALRVVDTHVLEELRDELASHAVRVDGIRAVDASGRWTVVLESHEQTGDELLEAIAPWTDDGRATLHAMEDSERLALLAGRNPFGQPRRAHEAGA